ncbi:MAG: hypothetical protein V4677_17065 [Bacteroidota bacterium]
MENQLFYPHIRWNFAKKCLLRFTLIFFCLQILPLLSYVGDRLYPGIAKSVFNISEISLETTGSGDMYYNYMELFVCFVIAFAGTIIWSLFNKREKNYDTLLHYFLIFIRYYLAYSMISYGFAKVFYNQFGAPGLERLLQTYGESSPMGIAWTFIGVSKPYTVFSGLAELLGGILLLTRKTTLAGALVSFAVMFNVMMLNFCYDVPVKLYSTQLVVLAAIIMFCNGHYLWNAIWAHKATVATINKPLFSKKWLKITRIIVKGLVVFYLIGFDGYEQYQSVYEVGPGAPKTPLYGIYKSVQIIKNNDTIPLYTYPHQWKYMVIDYPGYASVKQVNDNQFYMVFNVDTVKKNITASLQNDPAHSYVLAYKQVNDSTLNLKGEFAKNNIDFTFHKVDLKSFLLTNRGFHWVNEYPFNR